MAVFTYIGSNDWNAYSDIVGGSVVARWSTGFIYTSTTGLTVTLRGTGFVFDTQGLPTAGVVTTLDVDRGLVRVGHYTGLSTGLTDYVTKSFGQTHGVAGTTATDMGGLYGLMRSGDDVINGSDLNTTFLGYDGNDTIRGNAGDDWMQGGKGVDRYDGGTGTNGIFFDNDAQLLHGASVDFRKASGNILDDGYGNVETAARVQMVGGSNFADLLIGGTGAETLYGHGGNDTILAGAGNDYIQGGDGVDSLSGGAGTDTLSFSDLPATGQHGAVVNLGAAAGQPTVLDDGYGNADMATEFETLVGSSYGDSFAGNWRDNLMAGAGGNDSLYGGKGSDVLYGGAGNDAIYGGDDFNFLFGGKGVDRFYGGLDKDYLYFTDVDATGHGVNVYLGKASGQILDDGYGNTETALRMDCIVGSGYSDTLAGSNGVNFIWAGNGNDQLLGGGGFDQLSGEAGDDRLNGGSDIDTLTGGAGADTLTGGLDTLDFFQFDDIQPGGAPDHITDFQAGLDILVINMNWATDIAYGTLDATQFLSGAGVSAATTAHQRFLYDTTTGRLYFDDDGTGADPALLLLTLDNRALLTSDQISAIDTTPLPP